MGTRGPQPTPTSILEARGSWRAKVRENEPQLPTSAPACPRKLSKGARRWWTLTVPLLQAMKVLTAADGEVLSRYCVLADAFDEARTIDEQLKVDRQLRQVARDLGLTPASRSTVQRIDDSDEKEKPADETPRLRIA